MYASFKFPIKIVKQTNGNVFIFNANTGDYVKSLTAEYVELICNDNGIVKLVQEAGAEYFDPALVVSTQVLPAGQIAFNGTCLDLSQLLGTDFFFELTSSGACCDLDATLTVGNSAGANDIDLNNNDLLNVDKATFNLGTSDTAGVGQLVWNNQDGTIDLGMQGGLKNKIGHQLFVKARNNSGSAITKGSVVKVVGVAGGFIGINLAQGDSDANSATAFGIVAEDIADASNGFVGINGIIHGLNTNAFTEGDVLYLSPTVAGTFTNVKPVAPLHAVVIGYVAKKSATDGHILLHVQNSYELDELHDVLITTPANGNYLEYNGTVWVNQGLVYTIELIAALTVDFYAPYNMKINTISNILNSPTITILDDGVAYTLTNTIASGSKITVTATTASVVNLNITKA
jgi:hypothetical protein